MKEPHSASAAHSLLDLFDRPSPREVVRRVLAGLKQPRESGACRYARFQLQRIWSPVSAVIVPVVVLLLLLFCATPPKEPTRFWEPIIRDPVAPPPELDPKCDPQLPPTVDISVPDISISIDVDAPKPPDLPAVGKPEQASSPVKVVSLPKTISRFVLRNAPVGRTAAGREAALAAGQGTEKTVRRRRHRYAKQAKFHAGGNTWSTWNKALKPQFTRNQIVLKGAGSDGRDIGYWPPASAEEHCRSRVYNTTLCALTLQVYYRYLGTYSEPEQEASWIDEDFGDDLEIDVTRIRSQAWSSGQTH